MAGPPAMGAVVRLQPAGRAEAAEALLLAQSAPHRARELADGARRWAEADGDVETAIMAERALGLAARAVDDFVVAARHLGRAVDLAVGDGRPVRAAEARVRLAIVLAAGGRTDEALHELDLAAPVLRGRAAAQLQAQRAFILHRLGQLDEALRRYRPALSALRRTGDVETEAKLLTHRGILHAYRGEFPAAEADLRAAEARHVQLGQPLLAAEVRHNMGFVAARRGDVASALQWYDRAEADMSRLGVTRPAALLDRCETLLSVRLVDLARFVGRRAEAELAARGMEADLAEARLLLSQAALLSGDGAEATRLATVARAAFTAQRRPGWSALADYALVRAMASGSRDRHGALDAARRAVDGLSRAGWVLPAMDVRLIAARLALELGRLDEAEADLRIVARVRGRGPVEGQARAWHATALLRQARGDLRGADRALRAGSRVLALHQATLGATELRVQVGGQATELGALGLHLALQSRRPERVLAWAERCRAGSLRNRAARPPADVDLAGRLADLRQVVRDVEERGFEGGDGAPLLRRQAALEDQIRRMAWGASADPATLVSGPPKVDQLSAALGDAALVEFVTHEDQLHAVVVASGRARLQSLGPVSIVQCEVNALRFALGRLARGEGAPASRAAAAQSLRFASQTLDDILLGPLLRHVGDRPLVLVPTGPLHALPWSTLPSCWSREVTLSASAALWLRASLPPTAEAGGTVLVAGPGLAHAPAEIHQLAAAYPEATTLVGSAATTQGVASALDGAGLVHVAAHGRFRADNPLFSSLRLADGPLTVYDLESLQRAPRRLVLSACDAGLSSVRPGDELMGLASALLGMGSQSLVASVVPVPDDVTRMLMVDFHRRLAAGAGPAAALAGAQAAARGDDDGSLAATAGFVCFGAA